MIRTSTYATPKYALNDTRLVSEPLNITGTFQNNADSISAAVTISDGVPVLPVTRKLIALNGSTNIRFSLWYANALVSGETFRVTGWSKTNQNKYVPSAVYLGSVLTLNNTNGSFTGVDSAGGYATLINGVYMKPAMTMTPSTAGGVSASPNNGMNNIPNFRYIPGVLNNTPASLVFNTFGYSFLDIEFTASSMVASTNQYNAYVTEF